MSRGRRRPVTSLFSLWSESDHAHQCDRLADAIQDAAFEVMITTARGRRVSRRKWERRRVLVVVPNAIDVVPMRDRIRFCPFCGHRVPLVAAPPKRRRGETAVVPEALPEGW
jgi:hypothetical protein